MLLENNQIESLIDIDGETWNLIRVGVPKWNDE